MTLSELFKIALDKKVSIQIVPKTPNIFLEESNPEFWKDAFICVVDYSYYPHVKAGSMITKELLTDLTPKVVEVALETCLNKALKSIDDEREKRRKAREAKLNKPLQGYDFVGEGGGL